MNRQDKERIDRFNADPLMAQIIKEQLLRSFMRKREGDVTMKAAQMMAIELLEDAWKELVFSSKEKRQEPRQEAL